jgi:hypothetical protein
MTAVVAGADRSPLGDKAGVIRKTCSGGKLIGKYNRPRGLDPQTSAASASF